jgi:hypothetical protein
MERVEGSHRDRERVEGSVEDWPYHFEEADSLQEQVHQLGVRSCEATGVDSSPDFELEKPAGHYGELQREAGGVRSSPSR